MPDANLMDIPIRVHWAGWSSDTYTLKRQGWEVFARQEMVDYAFEHVVHIALKAPEGSLAIIGELRVTMEYLRFGVNRLADLFYNTGMEMKAYRALDRIHTYQVSAGTLSAWESMQPIDGLAYAPYDLPGASMDFKDLKLFKYQAPKEIYLPYKTVDQCLNRALELQLPQQKVLKAKAKPVVQATVYSVAG